MKTLAILICSFLLSKCVKSQNEQVSQIVGGPCEGCEAIYEYADKTLTSIDTLPGFNELKTNIKISGTVLLNDGKTPAKDVILYFYHTNDEGIYPSKPNSRGWERRHGYLRGWVKTDGNGTYTIYTSRPASYPNSAAPKHIHVTVKEPDKNEYYIDDFFFADDPNLTPDIKNRKSPRGGSGVISLNNDSPRSATRDIILGLNIPDY